MAGRALVTNHPINALIRQIEVFHSRDDFLEQKKLLNDVQRAGFDRIFLFCRQTAEQIQRADDVEVSLNGLTNVQNNLQNVFTELSNFFSNDNAAHIDNAIANLDGAITASSWTFFRRGVRGSHLYGEAISSVEASANQAITKLGEKKDELDQSLDELSTSLITLESKAAAVAASLEEVSGESSSAVTELNDAYSKFEQIAAEKNESNLKANAERFSGVIVEKAADADQALARIAELERQAKTIVQIVGNIGVTGNYQKRAESEQKQANIWRWVTIVLFGLGVALVTANLILNLSTSIDLRTLVIRFAIAVAVTVPAIYTARESARHRSNSDRAKQTELELASLSPFLENLPEEQRDEIIAELARSYFGQHIEDHKVESPVDVNRLLESVASITAKVNTPS